MPLTENSDNSDDIAYILIDPPVTPYSSEEDILAWIEELKAMPDLPEVRFSIAEAMNYLKMKKDFDR